MTPMTKTRTNTLRSLLSNITIAASITLAACSGGSNSGNKDGGNNQDGGNKQCTVHTVPCSDQSIQQLSFKSTVNNTAMLTNVEAGGVFTTSIDATGGGLTPTESYVYGRFTATGLERVAISDETSLDSNDWDIAFRRFVIRTNGGVSGPGCVTVARTAASTTFDGLTSEPAGLEQRTEEYFSDPTGTCEYVPDGSGLGSPGVALQSFWTYPGCVQMTDNVFILTLNDGKKVKFLVQQYYNTTVQDYCDENGELPGGSSGAGNVIVKWAFL